MSVLYYIASVWVVVMAGIRAASLPASKEWTQTLGYTISFAISVAIALLLFLAGRSA